MDRLDLRKTAAIARYRLKRYIGARPWLYFPIFRLKRNHRDLLVGPDTEICIEGFPRSANSFAVGAFKQAQQRPVRIAHHTHQPASIIRACQHSIPTLVLIREPADAVISRQALALETKVVNGSEPEVEDLSVSLGEHLRSWVVFYRRLLPYRDRFVVGRFEEVIRDFGQVTDRVNKKFGSFFEVFDHTPENVQRVNSTRGYHAGPSDRREAIKKQVRGVFEALSSESLRDKLTEATEVYTRITQTATNENARVLNRV